MQGGVVCRNIRLGESFVLAGVYGHDFQVSETRIRIGPMASTDQTNEGLLYQPDERPSHAASFVHGFQTVVTSIGAMAATASIIALSGGQSEDYAAWLFFTSLAMCGLGRILQTLRFWRFGSGYSISVVSASSFISVCITTVSDGGPAMLSSLMVVSALLQFFFVSRLSLLRRIITPTVTGTVLMLISATVISAVLVRLPDMPTGVPDGAAPILAGFTIAVLLGARLFAPPALQQWAPLIGIVAGCAIAAIFGWFDFQRTIEAPWLGIPSDPRLGFDLSFGVTFWALLPGFAIVIMATTIRAIGDTVAIQQVAWRRPRATDFRVVQGALNVIALTNLIAAAVGALPNTIGGSNSARVILTGVAARRMGVYGGIILIAVALLPKAIALAVSIPRPVLVAFIVFMVALLFTQGMRIALSDGMDGRKAAVIGLSFWVGVGFDHQIIFPDLLTGALGTFLSNGMTVGSVCVVALTVLMELTSLKRRRLNVEMSVSALPEIDGFLRDFAGEARWDEASSHRLRSAGEETLASLLSQEDEDGDSVKKRLAVTARRADSAIELEFTATSEGDNLEDKLAYLGDQPEIEDDREISFRLLRHYASSVQHRKYHDVDIVTVRVEGSRS